MLAAALVSSVGVGCAIVRVPEGVVGGVDLPRNLSDGLHEGMTEGDVIARFGAPSQRTRSGGVTTFLYFELSREGQQQLRVLWTPVGPDDTTRTELHLVFLNGALSRAWVVVQRKDGEPRTEWIVGNPGADSPE